MGLETGTYISDLVSTNPLGSDLKSEGDNHLRLIKATVKATFPNISGAVTPTHTELNYVDGVTSAIQTQLDAIGIQATGVAGVSDTDTLTSASFAKALFYNSATAGSITLPAASAGASGSIISVSCLGVGKLTINRAGSAVIYALGAAGTTSIVLTKGCTVHLYTDGTNWGQASGSVSLGAAVQSWQDMSASRAASTTYTNTTGITIEVQVALLASEACAMVATIDSLTLHGSIATISGNRTYVGFVVPHGSTYEVHNSAGTSVIADWLELRV